MHNGPYGGTTGWREKTLAIFVGILCSGDGLREINHRVVRERLSRREPQSKSHGEIRAKKRPGPQWKTCTHLSDSFPSLVTANAESAEIYRVGTTSLICASVFHILHFGHLGENTGVPVMQFGARTPGSGSHRDETTRLCAPVIGRFVSRAC